MGVIVSMENYTGKKLGSWGRIKLKALQLRIYDKNSAVFWV